MKHLSLRKGVFAAGMLFGAIGANAADCPTNTAVWQEAECADLSGTTELTGASLSGGKAVSVTSNDGYIKFNFDVEEAGQYKVYVGTDTQYGEGKVAMVKIGSDAVNLTINEAGEMAAGTFALTKGSNEISIVPGWTYFIIDYMRIEKDESAGKFDLSSSLVTPNATDGAKQLYKFLLDNFGKKTVSGFMTGNMDKYVTGAGVLTHEDVMAVYEKSGKYPALVGFDFLNATGKSLHDKDSKAWFQTYTDKVIEMAIDLWGKGGIPAFTWHWNDPSYDVMAFYHTGKNNDPSKCTPFDFKVAMDANGDWDKTSEVYKNMIYDIDVLADYFLKLQEQNIAAIFRPLHEASGGWFWWGINSGADYVKLYRLVYDEMVKEKGVKNLIWVWNPQNATDTDWNPGEEYYDIISVDIYNSAFDYQSNYIAFGNLKAESNSKKMIALSENGPLPDVEECYSKGASWSWWMPWYQSWGSNFADQTSEEEWKKVMSDERIITLDEMPGWEGVVVPKDPCEDSDNPLKVEAECAKLTSDCQLMDDSKASGGKKVNAGDAGEMTFKFNIEKAGQYNVYIGYDSPFGGKVVAVVTSDASVEASLAEIEGFDEVLAGSFAFSAGENNITLKPGWGWFVVDYVRIEADKDATKEVVPSATLVTPEPTESAKKLYSFLCENFGKKTISGFMTGNMQSFSGTDCRTHEDIQAVYTRSGKYPALVGLDFMNTTGKSAYSNDDYFNSHSDKEFIIAEDIWKRGGIPAFTWHWRDPSYATDAFYDLSANRDNPSDMSDFDFTKAMDANGEWDMNSEIYKNMMEDIDLVADKFLDLQKKGVAAIFRPLHEASGGWFWWGAKGQENCEKLYRLIFNELVNVKGVKNLIWVWNDLNWNPGAEYYDVVSTDIYNDKFDYQSNYLMFNNLKKFGNWSKLIALAENGPIPDVEDCYEKGATWSWWMPWNQSWGAGFADQTSEDEWKKVMEDERILTLEDMPGWDKYTASVKVIGSASGVVVYPSVVKNEINVKVDGAAQVVVFAANGKVVAMKTTNEGVLTIDASVKAKGIYFVQVTTENDVVIAKVVK